MNYKEALQEIINLYNSGLPLNKNTVKRCQQALEQSEPRMFSEEEVKPIATLPIPCNNFEGSYATSSATKCKWCGLEEWQHKEFKKLSILPESSNPIATDHTTIQPNQTEAEKEEVRKFVYLIEDTHPNRQGLWWGLEEVPLTSWETTFKAWTNDPLKAIQFNTFKEADEIRKKLNMDGYIVTEHEFVEMPPHEKVDSKPSLEPNQTEAEKEGIKGFLNSHLVPLDIKSAQFHFNQGRTTTIQEIEDWAKGELIKTNGKLLCYTLLDYLQTLKK